MKIYLKHWTLGWTTGLCLLLIALVLSGCGGSTASANTDTAGGAGGGQGQPQVMSAYLTRSDNNSLSIMMQAALGTLKLEGTSNAVTKAQAAKLLPLWQALQGNAITNGTERNAAYKQVEDAMTPAQMQAIAAMKLDRTALQSWAQSAGVQLPQFLQGPAPSPEAIATRRAQFQAQGGQGGQAVQAGQNGQGGQRRGQQINFLMDPLIKLLTTRAG